MFRSNDNNDRYNDPHSRQHYDRNNYQDYPGNATSNRSIPRMHPGLAKHDRIEAQDDAFLAAKKRRMQESDSDWSVPSVSIDSPKMCPLKELRQLASQEAQHFALDGKTNPKEVIFEPPNSPSKNPFEYLKEIAGSEASKLSMLGNSTYMRPQRITPSFTEKYSSSPRIKERRLSSDSAYDVSSSTIGQRSGPVRSFNDFDEGIFEFNQGSGRYACPHPECFKEFPSLSRIKRHYIIHTDIKPFKCPNKECPRTFSRKDNMLQHYHVHCPYSQYN